MAFRVFYFRGLGFQQADYTCLLVTYITHDLTFNAHTSSSRVRRTSTENSLYTSRFVALMCKMTIYRVQFAFARVARTKILPDSVHVSYTSACANTDEHYDTSKN